MTASTYPSVKQQSPSVLEPCEPDDKDRGVRARLLKLTRRRRKLNLPQETLVIEREAYRKLLYIRDNKDTEVGAMGLCRTDDPLWVKDFDFIGQECTSTSMDFDEQAQQDYFDQHMSAGENPEHFLRVFAHTHPGNSSTPSSTDWEMFDEVLGQCPWRVMLILSQNNQFACVMKAGEQMIDLPVAITPEPIPEAWDEQLKNIRKPQPKPVGSYIHGDRTGIWDDYCQIGATGFEQLTGDPLTPKNAASWIPSPADVFTWGPGTILSTLDDDVQRAANFTEAYSAKKAISQVFDVFGANPHIYQDFKPEKWTDKSPLCALNVVIESELSLNKARKKFPRFAGIDKFKGGNQHQAAFMYDGRDKEIAEALMSMAPDRVGPALADIVCCIYHFPKYLDKIDAACVSIFDEMVEEMQDYDIQTKEISYAGQ